MTVAPSPSLRGPVRRETPEPSRRTVVRRDVEGNELGTVELEPTIFGITPHAAVLHQVVTAQLAAARAGTHATRTRAEVRGGGAKPYRQKGTGRARQGSTRSPSFAGGGVAAGPKPRSYRQRTPKRMVRLALCSALSDRAAEQRVALVDRWGWELPRTKDARHALEALGLSGRVLVVLEADDTVAELSFRNLPEVWTLPAGQLAAYDVLRCDWVVFTDATLPGAAADAPGGTGADARSGTDAEDGAEDGPDAEPSRASAGGPVAEDGAEDGPDAEPSRASAGGPVAEEAPADA